MEHRALWSHEKHWAAWDCKLNSRTNMYISTSIWQSLGSARMSLNICMESQHGWVGRNLKEHPVPTPAVDWLPRQIRLPRALPHLVLGTHNSGQQWQCLTSHLFLLYNWQTFTHKLNYSPKSWSEMWGVTRKLLSRDPHTSVKRKMVRLWERALLLSLSPKAESKLFFLSLEVHEKLLSKG